MTKVRMACKMSRYKKAHVLCRPNVQELTSHQDHLARLAEAAEGQML